METLNLSESTPRSERRLKALFWPTIQNGSDVDYLGAQGYWVCTVVAVLSLVFLILGRQPIAGVVTFILYYVGGVGVRERSRYAAAVVFAMYFLDTLVAPGIVRIVICGLLLSNLRATWIAARWKPDSEDALLPPRFSETLTDKFVDRVPMWLWPKVRILYCIFSAVFLLFLVFGLLIALGHRL